MLDSNTVIFLGVIFQTEPEQAFIFAFLFRRYGVCNGVECGREFNDIIIVGALIYLNRKPKPVPVAEDDDDWRNQRRGRKRRR